MVARSFVLWLALTVAACSSGTLLDTPTAPTTGSTAAPVHVGFTPPAILASRTSRGTITLTLPAPSGGVTVALSSSDPTVAVPATVVVPAGATSAEFVVTTTGASIDREVSITGNAGGRTVAAPLRVWAILPTFFNYVSDSAGGFGFGRSSRVTPDHASFTAQCRGNRVEVRIQGAPETFWSMEFGASGDQPLGVRTYEGAVDSRFAGTGSPLLWISPAAAPSCSNRTSRFVVHEADFTSVGGVRQFWATFERGCGTNPPLALGDIRVSNVGPIFGLSPESCTLQ